MKKENVEIFKKIACTCLSACIAGQSFGFMPVKASSSDGDDIEKRVKPKISCKALVSADTLLSDLRSEESKRLIGRIFLSISDYERIITKALSSPGHMNLLRIGFEVCLAYEQAPEEQKTLLREWERSAVCRLIRLFWNSSFIDKQTQRYQDNKHIKFYMKHVSADEKLHVSVAERYLDRTLFRMAYLDKVDPYCRGALPHFLVRNAKRGAANCILGSLILVCVFDKGKCPYLADCIWGLISQHPIFKKYGSPFSGNCGFHGVNDFGVWMDGFELESCRKGLEDLKNASFGPLPEEGLLCSTEFLDELEKRAISRRAEEAERDAKIREREESRLRKIEKRREQELKQQERKAQQRERQKLLLEEKAEAERQAEEEIRRRDQEAAKRKEEAEDGRRAEEKAKRDAEEAAEREKEARLKAEHDASGVTAVIDANARIWKSHANEPNHDDKGLKFQK